MNTIIPQNDYDGKQIDHGISTFFKKFTISFLLRQSNFRKLKGASCFAVFSFIFQLIFTGKNLYQFLKSKHLKNFLLRKMLSIIS